MDENKFQWRINYLHLNKELDYKPLVAAGKYNVFRFYDKFNKAFVIKKLILFIAKITNHIQPRLWNK